MKENYKIDPCPFCGGEADIIRGNIGIYCIRSKFKIYCKVCQVRQIFHKTLKSAIADWNSRKRA